MSGAPIANGHEPARRVRLDITPWSSRDGDWRLSAACRSVDPEQFFPISAIGTLEQVVAAKAICARCPVELECLAFALRTRQAHGIWGGLTEQDRQHIGPAQRTAVQSTNGVTTTIHRARPDA